jgi:hypothetical protein
MQARAKRSSFGCLPLALAAAAAIATTGCTIESNVIAEGSFDRSLTVGHPVDLSVETGSGGITIRAGASDAVQVHGIIKVYGRRNTQEQAEQKVRSLSSNPPIEQDGNVIRIGRIEDRELRRVSISYEVVVPADTTLRSDTGSGSQTVEGIHGPATVKTGSGNVKISGIGQEVRATTGSGGIQIDSVKGPVNAQTGSGSIHASNLERGIEGTTGSGTVEVKELTGDADLDTGSGSIRVEGFTGSLKAHTGSGNLSVQGEPTGDWRLQTGSGSIHVKLPTEAAFEIDAQAISGSISMSHPLTAQGAERKRALRGKVRGGGPLLHMRSGSGNMRVE